jgi:transcription antitermination factor NusG
MASKALSTPLLQFNSASFAACAWYAVRTRSNAEKLTAQAVLIKGYEAYLPLYRARRRWSDRIVEKELPLFPGYFFCKFDPQYRLPILTTPGVVSIITAGRNPVPIPEDEIASIRAAIESGMLITPCAYLAEGERVRVLDGPLQGVEGILVRKKNQSRIVLSVDILRRSVSIEIDHDSAGAI